jgi:predicted O-linked N-acetylglucosamine transferase (SPINDLY family)
MWSELRPDVLLNVDSIAQTDDRTSASTTTAASGHNSLVATASNRKLRRAVRIKAGSDQAGIQSTIGTDADLASRFEMLRVAGNYKDAEILAREITVRFPNSGFGWKALGAALKAQGRTRESLIPMQMAAKLASFDAGTHSNLGVTLKDLGRLEEAAASFRSALKIRPDFAEGHNNLGNTLRQLGRMLEARACFERALELKPDYTDALINYGNVLYDSGLLESAENCYRQALQVRPDFCEAHNNLGNTLAHLGCIEEAMACFRRALALNPDYLGAQSNLLFNLNYSAGYDQSYYLAEARKYGHMASVSSQNRFSAWRCSPRPDRLRIGLVSGDLRGHPVGYFLESILARIDPGRIELIAYTTDPRVDSMTTRIRPFFSAWNSLVGLDDAAAANLIHADGIHVLLDLSGHTDKNRLPVFARKPAPLQISWLGYFATTGVAEIDYFLADATGVPDHLRWQFTETVWHLPETRLCFTAPPENVPVASLPARDNGFVTFGCFQNLAKVGDNVVRLWGIILAALPDARLRLQTRELGDPATCERFRLRLQKNNIAIERVILQGAVSRTEYLAAHADVDLILDTFPYPGGTTTCEALWMGVPTVTLAGDSLLARQGASILTSAGLADFVALSEADYIANAVTLAADVTRLARLRSGLRQQILTSPLFDAPRFARNFEDAVWSIWNQRQQML